MVWGTYMLIVKDNINRPISNTDGIDTLKRCLDQKHFQSYKKEISYKYNTRGFRDEEWPADLSDVIWCVGDSFTVGVGQPFLETWPQILQKKTGKRCLNISEDGCSNDTIALRIKEIAERHRPKYIVVMWSFFHRRRKNGKNIHHDPQDFGRMADVDNFVKNYSSIEYLPVKMIHSVIPNALELGGKNTDKESNYLVERMAGKDLHLHWVEQVDFARDGFHYDIATCEKFTDLVASNLNI